MNVLVLLTCAGRPPQELRTPARQRAVDVLAVLSDQVELLDLGSRRPLV